MNYPSDAPLWVRALLQLLTSRGSLSGVPGPVLAAICRFTSNYGIPALGINATGFGGYFGQHVGWAYPLRPQGFTRTELLNTNNFQAEAIVAAATLASYKLPLGEALLRYSGGSTSFVQYVTSTTGVPTSYSFVSKKEGEVPTISSYKAGDQSHVYVVLSDGTVLHWWQASTGTTKWHRETLPSKTD